MKLFLFALVLLVSACAQEAVMQSGPNAEKNDKGLTRVDNSRFDETFVKPNVDFASYTSFLFVDLNFDDLDVVDPELDRGRKSKWEFDSKDEKQFAESYMRAVSNNIEKKGKYFLTENPGSATLMVKSSIKRFAPSAPKYDSLDRGPRSKIYTSSSGNMTIVSELIDSETGELLATLEDRREMWDLMDMRESTRMRFSLDLNRAFDRWASVLRARLDRIHANAK